MKGKGKRKGKGDGSIRWRLGGEGVVFILCAVLCCAVLCAVCCVLLGFYVSGEAINDVLAVHCVQCEIIEMKPSKTNHNYDTATTKGEYQPHWHTL